MVTLFGVLGAKADRICFRPMSTLLCFFVLNTREINKARRQNTTQIFAYLCTSTCIIFLKLKRN
jgi:hypothetical protein